MKKHVLLAVTAILPAAAAALSPLVAGYLTEKELKDAEESDTGRGRDGDNDK